jgi:hypothetical protein
MAPSKLAYKMRRINCGDEAVLRAFEDMWLPIIQGSRQFPHEMVKDLQTDVSIEMVVGSARASTLPFSPFSQIDKVI